MSASRSTYMFGRRSRSGCWTCRRRHQKCDETKPTCRNCRQRGVECGGYGITLTDFTAYRGPKGQMVSKMRRDGPEDVGPEDSLGRSSQLQTKQAERNTLTISDIFHRSISPPETPDTFSLARSDASPECSPSETAEDDNQVGYMSTSTDDFQTGSHEGNLASGIDKEIETQTVMLITDHSVRAPPNDQFEQHLFSHYMNSLVLRLYPVKLAQNPYRVVYGALATESAPLMKAIQFASALHLSQLGQLPKFAIQPYRMAMRDSFRDALADIDKAWSLGVTVLLTVIFDVIGTGLDAWSSKLIGCRRLLEMGLSKLTGKLPATLQCVLLQYNWVVTMGRALVKGLVSPTTFDELECIDGASALERVIEDIHMATNQSHWWDNLPDFHMYQFLRKSTEYSVAVDRLRASPDSTDSLLELMPTVAELINQIQNWRPDMSVISAEYKDSVLHFNEIWRLGMLCYIYSDVYGLDSGHPYIQGFVESSLEHVQNLSWFQACLFPTFMIAVHCKTHDARVCFEAGLRRMHTSLAFHGPLSVYLTLKKIWEHLENNTGKKASWRDIIKDFGMELNILL